MLLQLIMKLAVIVRVLVAVYFWASLAIGSNGCGVKSLSTKVVNGQDASPHSWPWQVSLRVLDRYGRPFHICGGSLIRPDWIVTAAHCVNKHPEPSRYTVVVGAHTLPPGETDVQQEFHVEKVIPHERFSMGPIIYDVAVLQLSGKVRLSSKVNTVCLPDSDADLKSVCYITGWGRTSTGRPDVLQQAQLPLVSDSQCKSKYGKDISREHHLCAGKGEYDVPGGCSGDSGGPLVCKMGGRWYLHGAVSFGAGKCSTYYYTVFARITSYKSWILRKIGDGGPNPPPQTPRPPTCTDILNTRRCNRLKRNDNCHLPIAQKNCRMTCETC